MATIAEQNKALSKWACGFLAINSPQKPKRTRRLSYSNAWLAAKREQMRMRVFGHYGDNSA